MTARISCKDVEALLFEHHRDELSDLKQAEVDEHLSSCSMCRELTSKFGDVFALAAGADTEAWADIDADGLFDRIETAIGDPDAHSAHPDARLDEAFAAARISDSESHSAIDPDQLFDRISQQIDDSGPSKITPTPPRKRWPWAVAVVAASVALITWWGLSEDLGQSIEQDIPETTAPVTASSDEAEDGDEDQPPGFAEEDEEPLPAALALPSMRPAPSQRDSVKIFTTDDAEFRIDDSEDKTTIELDSGSILVEYLPDRDSELSLHTRGYTITVVGTVFFVTIEDERPQVAVFEGAVRMTSPDESRHKLVATGELFDGADLGVLSEEITSQVAPYVDLDAHRLALRHAREEAKRPVEDPSTEEVSVEEVPEEALEVPEATDPEPPSVRELRRKALQALYDGEFRQATTLLASALEKTEPTEQATADILLELARIHMRELDEPEQAAAYLSRFINQWPDDPAAEAIRTQLCDMSSLADSDEEMCH